MAVQPIDLRVDHVRDEQSPHVILEYGDYECPYSRAAYRAIETVQRTLGGEVAFVFRHFPLTDIHPHALAAAFAAEAAAQQQRFWEMHDLLYHNQKALEESDLRGYATEVGLDLAIFERDRTGAGVEARVRRDVDSGIASGDVQGTPTLFIDGALHDGATDSESLIAAIRRL
ncbi:MAG: DsbA family protein [Candidatus Dormibacteria bacterium]